MPLKPNESSISDFDLQFSVCPAGGAIKHNDNTSYGTPFSPSNECIIIYQSANAWRPHTWHIPCSTILVCPRCSNEKRVPNEFMAFMSSAQTECFTTLHWLHCHTVSLLGLIMGLEAEWEKSEKKVLDNHHILSLLVLRLCCFEVRYIFVNTSFSI